MTPPPCLTVTSLDVSFLDLSFPDVTFLDLTFPDRLGSDDSEGMTRL